MSSMCVECGEFTNTDQVIKCKICPLTYHKWCAKIDLLHRIRVKWHCPKNIDLEIHFRCFDPQHIGRPPASDPAPVETARLLDFMNVGTTYMPMPLDDADMSFTPMDHERFGPVEYRQTPYGMMLFRPCGYRSVKSKLMIYKPGIYIPPMQVPTMYAPVHVPGVEVPPLRPPQMHRSPMQMPPTHPPPMHIPIHAQMHVQQQMPPRMMAPQMPMGMPTRPPVFAGYNGGYNRYNRYH